MNEYTHTTKSGRFIVPLPNGNPSVAGTGPIFARYNGRLYRLVPVDIPGDYHSAAQWARSNGWPKCTRRERLNSWIDSIWYTARRST